LIDWLISISSISESSISDDIFRRETVDIQQNM
jgi:hypothetical protein